MKRLLQLGLIPVFLVLSTGSLLHAEKHPFSFSDLSRLKMVGETRVSPDGITQAEEMFIALKKRGVDTVMVRYPGEGHGIRQPKHIVDMHRRVLNWFDHYVKGEGTTSSR